MLWGTIVGSLFASLFLFGSAYLIWYKKDLTFIAGYDEKKVQGRQGSTRQGLRHLLLGKRDPDCPPAFCIGIHWLLCRSPIRHMAHNGGRCVNVLFTVIE
ncbi:hypothetical protein VL03_10140 [Rossellomorea marisflavi]|nr:hypothetical protein VL03_10140 [Rossellomorea marisflavi]